MYRPPVALVALRKVVLGGTTFARGQRLTKAQVVGLVGPGQHLLARNVVGTIPDLYGRKGAFGRLFRPSYLPPKVLSSYQDSSTTALAVVMGTGANSMKGTFTISGTGYTPTNYWIAFGDGTETTGTALTLDHVYTKAGTYTAVVTAWSSSSGKSGTDSASATPTTPVLLMAAPTKKAADGG